MSASIYVCHRGSDVELAARLVDLLELAFDLPEGSLGCSTLPGYVSSAPRAEGLRELAEHAEVVLVPLTDPLSAEQTFELGALWSAGRWIVAIEGDPSALLRLPAPLDNAQHVALTDRGALTELLEDIGFRLGVVVRAGRVSTELVTDLCAMWPGAAAAATKVGDASYAIAAMRKAPISEPAPDVRPEAARKAQAREQAAVAAVTAKPPAPKPSVPPTTSHASSSVPPRLLGAVPPAPVRVGSMPPRAPSVPPPPPSRRGAAPRADIEPEDDFEVVDASALDPVVEISCELSLKAGRAISTCAFHGLENQRIDDELDASFGRFLDAVGGRWEELRNLADPDVWLGVTDNLLEGLPPDQRHLSTWYELGFQLTTLHNLATEDIPSDVEGLRVYQQAFDDALEAFRQSAAAARLRYEDVAELEGLLRNLSGPPSQRDYSNISLSLAQLAFHAEQADQAQLFN